MDHKYLLANLNSNVKIMQNNSFALIYCYMIFGSCLNLKHDLYVDLLVSTENHPL